ncbi:hypothetical protein H0H92_009506 [Tricholoma furcatifolium]|nr:hypothetical protein H0H92_009506 [Tricholoma furcatifolium]
MPSILIKLGFKLGFPARFKRLFNCNDQDAALSDSSRVHALPTVTPGAIDATIPPTSTTLMPEDDSFLRQAGQFVRYGFNVASPVVSVIPVASGPLKAAIGSLLVVLNSIDQAGQNKKDIVNLIKHLQRLDATITSMPTPPL